MEETLKKKSPEAECGGKSSQNAGSRQDKEQR